MTRAGARPPPGLEVRAAAHALLLGVIERHQPLEDRFATAAVGFEPRDRAFVRRLATTALRRFGQAEALLAPLLDRGPLPQRQTALRALLVLAATELIFLGTPAHAAIDSAVRLARAKPNLAGQAGLVNAVLRRLARELPMLGTVEARVPASYNTPSWLKARWRKHYGVEVAEAFALAHVLEPPLDITVRGDPGPWAEPLQAELLPTGSLRRPTGGRIGDLPGYTEGAWWIQDAAAAIPARLLGDVAGQPVLDLCAAPGGKTAQLAAAGARVTAVERDAGRLARLEINLARLKLEAELECADAATWTAPAPFPFILLDAPCSATGTLRRHPDLPWLKRESDLAQFAATQTALLNAAIRLLKPGGTLVYSVCSLEPEEGEERIRVLLRDHPSISCTAIGAMEHPALAEFITPEGFIRTTPAAWSGRGGLDGFFAARLRADASKR